VGVPSDAPLTFHRTARRSFEIAYWRTIARLACGKYVNKDNADCVRDPVTSALLGHHRRDLEALGDYLLDYYRRLVERAGMGGRAAVGDLPFHWQTDFNFPWSGGWRDNQEGKTEERDLLVMIPGRDRRRAVIMADHYDTAYMEDVYEKHETGTEVAVGTDHHKGNTSSRQPPPSPFSPVGSGARLAAAGADDNHSATAALMLGAPVFMELSRRGQLGCDVWLVHLTGEEFPSDCMGARHLAQSIVEGSLKLRRSDQELPSHSGRGAGGEGHVGARRPLDLSGVQIDGVYVLDMVAHNNENDPDVFQISPGTTGQSLRLAEEAHLANLLWNAGTLGWNRSPSRRAAGRGKRIRDPRAAKKGTVPICAQHPEGGHQPKVGRGKWGLSPFSPAACPMPSGSPSMCGWGGSGRPATRTG
jgi:hypothetical protein